MIKNTKTYPYVDNSKYIFIGKRSWQDCPSIYSHRTPTVGTGEIEKQKKTKNGRSSGFLIWESRIPEPDNSSKVCENRYANRDNTSLVRTPFLQRWEVLTMTFGQYSDDWNSTRRVRVMSSFVFRMRRKRNNIRIVHPAGVIAHL